MSEKPSYGYPSVEALVFAFVRASHLVSKTSPIYVDVRQLAEGKRRFYSAFSETDKKTGAKDLPGIASILRDELGRTWATPEMADEISKRLADYVSSYLRDFVRKISAANIRTSEVWDNLRPLFFAQRIAVDLSWLEQKWGIGLLPRILSQTSSATNPVGTALKWMRKLERLSAAEAARLAGKDPEVEGMMDRWENGRHLPRRDSFPLVKALYRMEKYERYRLWFWIALLLEEAGEEFRQEIAAALGRGFDLDAARAPLVELSNSRIISTGVPESFNVLQRLLCSQMTDRTPHDLDDALAALEDLRAHISSHDGIAEYHIHAMEARIAVFSEKPLVARDAYRRAIALARYAEPTVTERLLREFAALCAHEGYAIPLKNATDTQWLFGLHPIQIRRAPLWEDDTTETITDSKRAFDYYRYFPPQLFFTSRVDSALADRNSSN